MSSDEPELTELRSRTDLSGVPVDKMIRAAKQARSQRAELHEFMGKLIARLNQDHGMSFAQIGKLLEMPHSTAHHMAKRYL